MNDHEHRPLPPLYYPVFEFDAATGAAAIPKRRLGERLIHDQPWSAATRWRSVQPSVSCSLSGNRVSARAPR